MHVRPTRAVAVRVGLRERPDVAPRLAFDRQSDRSQPRSLDGCPLALA
jgi:hypothetical protein